MAKKKRLTPAQSRQKRIGQIYRKLRKQDFYAQTAMQVAREEVNQQ